MVIAEVTAGLGHGADVLDVLEAMGLRYSALDERAAVRAGEMQRKYKQRRRDAGLTQVAPRAIPDFMVGAHAMMQCNALITRDEGFYRDYFKGLRVIVPALP